MVKVGRILAIVGLLGGGAGMTTPLVMGQTIVKQEVRVKKIKGEEFTLQEIELTAKKGAVVYSKPDTSSEELYVFDEKATFVAEGYSDEWALVLYEDAHAFIHLSELDLKGTGIKAPKKSEAKKKAESVFPEKTILALEELGIDLGEMDLTDASLYEADSLKTFKDAVIAYARSKKEDSTKEYPDLLKAMEDAKAGLLFADGSPVFKKAKEEPKTSESTTSSSSTTAPSSSSTAPSSTTQPSSEPTPAPAPAPAPARDAAKFQFPSVPENLNVVDGKTMASVHIEAETMQAVDGKSSPNFSTASTITNIPAGTKLTITELSIDGFGKVNYNGQDMYVDTNSLR